MRKRHTIESVKEYFKKHGCELLEEEYKNCDIPMKYKCSCKNISKIKFINFKNGQRCKKCGYKKIGEKKKFSFKFIHDYFKKQNCELLEKEYKDTHTLMKYKCSCGNMSKISFNSFKNGSRCQKCAKNEKYKIKYIKKYFKKHGCELLEEEYKNTHTPMLYICNCGNMSKISFSSFKKGSRCSICANEIRRKKRAFTFKYVKQYFKEHGCELLEKKYKNAQTPMLYICNCGNNSKIRLRDFQRGRRCKKCGIEKLTGKNNPCYNPNLTDEDRKKNKSRSSDPSYRRWRRKIFKINNFTCKKCFKKGGILNAHHIKSWASNKKLRLVESNGITFCEKHHKEFHKKYGKTNNNRNQLNEFLNIKNLKIAH